VTKDEQDKNLNKKLKLPTKIGSFLRNKD